MREKRTTCRVLLEMSLGRPSLAGVELDVRETGVDVTESRLCPVVGFGVCGVRVPDRSKTVILLIFYVISELDHSLNEYKRDRVLMAVCELHGRVSISSFHRHCIVTGSSAHPLFCQVGAGDSFHGGRHAGTSN
jgi:hypothetical protein